MKSAALHEIRFLLLLAWNLAQEIMSEQAAFRARGGRFIVPLPEPRVVA